MHLASFAAAQAALQTFSHRPSQRSVDTTEYVAQFMDYIGNPQNAAPAVHIAGTSGKTSTAYYTAALLQAAGLKVGLLTSPHVWCINERVQINLEPLPEAVFCRELGIFIDIVKQSGVPLTASEVLYAFAYWQFAEQGVEYMVIETGRGGLLDATNVISRSDKVCIITDIGQDHAHILGNTLARIAEHKAGIIGLHNTVFCYLQNQTVARVVQDRARHKQADMHVFNAPPDSALLAGLPAVQRRNGGLALRTVEYIVGRLGGPPLGNVQLAAALQVHIPGRLEVRQLDGVTVVVDGAHNSQKLQGLMDSLARQYPGQPLAALAAFAHSQGRDMPELIAALSPVHHLITTAFPASEPGRQASRPASELATVCGAGRKPFSYESVPNARVAFRMLLARPEPIKVVTGSFRLVQQVIPPDVK